MAEHKYGCDIVVNKSNQYEHGKVVGIFTANDGLKVFINSPIYRKKVANEL